MDEEREAEHTHILKQENKRGRKLEMQVFHLCLPFTYHDYSQVLDVQRQVVPMIVNASICQVSSSCKLGNTLKGPFSVTFYKP